MVLTQELQDPLKGCVKAPGEDLQPRHPQHCRHTRAQQVISFWVKNRAWEDRARCHSSSRVRTPSPYSPAEQKQRNEKPNGLKKAKNATSVKQFLNNYSFAGLTDCLRDQSKDSIRILQGTGQLLD